jgi:hypothetical protein
MNPEKTSSESRARLVKAESSETQLGLYTGMHDRYREDHDLLNETERARLRFIRWLYETGGISP